MARWRLTAPHYLNVKGTTWEYKELDRATGKQIRRNFDVPTHLDPDNPGDWNYVLGKDAGEIIVADKSSDDYPKDLIFFGEPTPDMFPLDAEANKISQSLATKWKHPIESLDGNFSGKLLDGLQVEMAKMQAAAGTAKVEGMDQLLAAMAAMMKQNQDLIATMTAQRRA